MVLMSHALGRSIEDVTMLTAYQLLACACYGPIGSALAHKYGKRPQFIFASVMGFVGTLVCCTTGDNYGVLLAGRIIQGFGSAVFESLTVAVMGDMFFVHERSLRTGLLVMTWTCIISLVSILGGVIAEGLGWRYVFIIHLPFTVVGLLSVFFFLPETQWKGSRSHISSEAADQAEDKEMASVSHGHEENLSESSLPEAKKTFMQEIAIFSGTHTDANLLRLVFAPFAVIINPAVIWSIAVGGACIGFYVAISYILAQIWTPPPYNLNAHQNGTFYVGALIGGVSSSIAGPWLGDIIAQRMTKWNKGTYEPEFRIPMMNWLTTIGSGSDAFRENSTEIFILLMTAKNFIFYGFSQVMNTWAEEKGPSDVLRTFGIITMCLIGTSPVLYIFGKVNRSFMHKTRLMRRLTGKEDVLRPIP
ncbi:Major facilitator superfamily domain general substrate transporter [Penicillium expansum]|nr:Major facilitator superfamily domain general substrate transporter [Penicillium expansum]